MVSLGETETNEEKNSNSRMNTRAEENRCVTSKCSIKKKDKQLYDLNLN